MTRSSNTVGENREDINTKKSKKADESMTTRAIKQFIEKKLSLGGDVFNQMMGSKCVGLESEFLEFISRDRAFDEQSKEQQEAFKAVTSARFLRETIALGAAFTSKRKALEHVINRGYSFTGPETKMIQDAYESLTRDELTTLTQSESKREKFLKNLFPNKTLPYTSAKEQIDVVFGHNNLTQDQEERVMKLLTENYVDPLQVQEILPLFDGNQKQLLLKIFLPTVTLGELGDMGVLTHAQMRGAVQQSIDRGHLVPQFENMNMAEKSDAVDSIDPYDIVIETQLFPQDIVDTILEGQGSKMIAQELSRLNTARYEDALSENSLKMQPTKEGLFLPPFLQKLKNLNIKNPEDFKEGSIIQGVLQGEKGEDIKFAYRIDGIIDDVNSNKLNKSGNGYVFAISDVLLPDGSLRLGTKKSGGADCTYAEMYHIFDKAKTNIEILTPQGTKDRIESGTIKETLLDEELKTLADMNRAMNSSDPKGSAYSLRADGGASIQVGEPGGKDYCIFQIKSINESNGTIELIERGGSEILDYVTFYSAFKSKNAKRIPSMKTAEEFLSAMKSHGTKGDAYGKLSLDGDKIVSEERKGEKGYLGITEFYASKGCVKILDTKTPGQVEFLVYEDFDESKGLDKQSKAPYKYNGGYNLLFNFLNRDAFKPKNPSKKTAVPDQVDPHIHYHEGRMKHYMGNPSLHDILHGAKGVIDAIKHKLEHGSHLHAANVQLAIGKGMKSMGLIQEGFLREMRTGVHVKNKKLMQEMVDELKNMSGGDRQSEVMHILENKGSHDYEIQAATMAMLQKHGALYVGKLKKWEGSFVYFERISGLKFSENLEAVKKYRERCDLTDEPFTEEGLIISYIKTAGDNHELDGTLWTDIAKAWGGGMKEETEKGKDETAKFQTTKGRMRYVMMDKLKEGEKAHAIGGFDAIWSGGGSAHEMHMPAIVLALSNMPGTMSKDQLKALKNKFFGGHPYSALLFLGTSGHQNIFRTVIKKLAVSNGMAADYKKIEDLQKKDPDKKLIEAIMEFWTEHGETLNKKLNVTEDGELLYLAKTDSDCATYLETCKSSLINIKKLDNDELENEAYDSGGSSFLGLNPDHYFKFIKMNPAQAIPDSDDTTKLFWSGFQKSLKAIGDMSAKTPEIKKEIQKNVYMKYHKAFLSHMNSSFKKSVYEEDLPKQNYIQELDRKYAIRLTLPSGKEFLETQEYHQRAEEDFEAYLAGGRAGKIETEIKNVGGSVGTLLKKTGYKGPAANDSQVRQSA